MARPIAPGRSPDDRRRGAAVAAGSRSVAGGVPAAKLAGHRRRSNAYNTTGWSAGAEFGRAVPLRIGVRGGDLPFGPGGQTPREFAFAFGTGRTFAGGRGIIDVTLERLRRTGAGLTETGWTALLSVAVRP